MTQGGAAVKTHSAKRLLGMDADGPSYWLIARSAGLSKNTVMDIVRRNSGELSWRRFPYGGSD